MTHPRRFAALVLFLLCLGPSLWATPEVYLSSQGQQIAATSGPASGVGLELGEDLYVSVEGFPPVAKVRFTLQVGLSSDIKNLLRVEKMTDLGGRIPEFLIWWRTGIDKCPCPWTLAGHPFSNFQEAESVLVSQPAMIRVRAEVLPVGSAIQAEAFTYTVPTTAPQYLVVGPDRSCEARLLEIGRPLLIEPKNPPDQVVTVFWVDARRQRAPGSPIIDVRPEFPRGQTVMPGDWPLRWTPHRQGAFQAIIRRGTSLDPTFRNGDVEVPRSLPAGDGGGPDGVLVSEWPPACP